MKKYTILIILIYGHLVSFSQNWMWGKQGNNSSGNAGDWVVADKNGNAYLCGFFDKRIIFNKDTLVSNGYNSFLVKYDSNGNEIWARQAIINDSNDNNGVSADAIDDSGNVLITGYFDDTIMFGSITLVNGGIFIVKYDANGNILWARQSNKGTPANCYVTCITSDLNNNIIITGEFADTLIFGATVLIPTIGIGNCYTAKYDPNGNLIWAKQSIGRKIFSYIGSGSVSTDATGNIYITGYFKDSVWFGITKLYSSNGSSFIAKYNATGNLIWAVQGNGPASGYSIVNDKIGCSYITGSFSSSVSFGSISLNTTLMENVFLAKYDSMGNAIWAESASNGELWEGSTLSIDLYNHIYLSGFGYSDTLDFGGSTFSDNKNTYRGQYSIPAFLIKLDTAGRALCGSFLHNGIITDGKSEWVTSSSSPNGKFVYLAGTFDIDTLYCGLDTLISDTSYNPYVTRLNDCNTSDGINRIEELNDNFTVYPNPSNGVFNIAISHQLSAISSIEVYNELGKVVYSVIVKLVQHDVQVNLSNLADGIYTLKLQTENGIIVKKLVVMKR